MNSAKQANFVWRCAKGHVVFDDWLVSAQFGIGEEVRMAARAFQAAKAPFTLLDFSLGDRKPQNDRSMELFRASSLTPGLSAINSSVLAGNGLANL